MGLVNTQLTNATLVQANNTIPVGNIVHRNSCNLSASGSTWKIKGAGYYKIIANVTIQPAAVAETMISIEENGVIVAQSATTPATAGDSINITVVGVVYNKCGCAEDAITLVVSSQGTVTESNVIIERM